MKLHKFTKLTTALLFSVPLVSCTQKEQTSKTEVQPYTLACYHEVNGRQGVACEGDYYYVSGSTTLTKYDKNWNIVAQNDKPFAEGYELEVNHIGDIDVYNGEIYCGVELFLDGVASNIQIAVYDSETLTLKRTFPFESESGQNECSGIAVNPDEGTVWMCAWPDDEAGHYVYQYKLESGEYLGKTCLDPAPKWIQGIAYHKGAYYLTADDGDADNDQCDHVYKAVWCKKENVFKITEEKKLDDIIRQGEIEGLTFDTERNQLLVLYNRGARIILGMPSGFYSGYDHEIHEVYTYNINK